MSDAILEALQAWYRDHCDGDWEHQYGVVIETLDNPGWIVKIDLTGTELESKPFTPIDETEPDSAWIHCKVRDRRFEGACAPTMLSTAIRHFLDWANA